MPEPRKTARYGWKPQLPDHRDHVYQPELTALPAKVDLSGLMPPIWDQGQLGSCTGNGIARVLVYEALKQGESLPGLSNDNAGLSRLFIYYNERVIEGTVQQDAGANIRDGIKAVAAQGAPLEADWPYSDANPGPFQQQPTPQAYSEGLAHKAIQYQAVVPGGGRMRAALAAGHPIVFGFSVPAYFEGGSWDPATQILPLPGPADQIIGGHCVVISGYDWTGEPSFQIENSWGTGWGAGGRFRMAAGWFDPSRGLATDLWLVQRVA